MKKKEYKKRLEKEKKEMRELGLNDNNNMKTFLIIAVCVIGFVLLMFVFLLMGSGEL